MTYVIRAAGPADFVRVGEITLNAYVQDGHLPSEAEYGGMLADARKRAEEAELWVAADPRTDEVLGSVTFAAPGSTYNEVSDPGEGEFRMLAVSHAARGQGVGEALVQHCITRARELGLTALVMSTQPSMTAAHRIYERLGFERTPEKDWKPVPEVSLLTYRLALRAPASAGGAGTPTVG